MEKPKRTPPPKKKNQAFMLKIQKFKNLKILKFSFCKKLETCHATCHVMTIKLKKNISESIFCPVSLKNPITRILPITLTNF